MKRRAAVKRCWDLVNENRHKEAYALMRKQRRTHGNRMFSYWLRLTIINGMWSDELGGL